jgi:hypothetical protein
MCSSSVRFCSCSPPDVVDLTDFFYYDENGDDSGGGDHRQQLQQQKLQSNFEQYGWSPVEVRVITGTNPPVHSLEIPSLWYKSHQWKQILSSLFTPEAIAVCADAAPCTLIRDESGSPQNSEAKISWELLRRHSSNGGDSDPNERRPTNHPVVCHLQDWIWIVHRIVQSTCRAMGLSSDCLLLAQSSHDNKTTKNDNNNNMDLLRAFSYDVVAATVDGGDNDDEDNHHHHHPDPSTAQTGGDASSLGSSPHTDWGSWTVIWQDHVGGLQTFCHYHQRYHPVTPVLSSSSSQSVASAATNTVRFIVHVGDVTSLAMSMAYQKRFWNQCRKSHEEITKNEEEEEEEIVVWPSPRHRVISPTREKRHSLVYFAYPSPDSTIQEISDRLYDEYMMMTMMMGTKMKRTNRQNIRIPYEDYFLLRDQSTSAKNNDDDEEHIHTEKSKQKLDSILTKELGTVFQEKWQQVQR